VKVFGISKFARARTFVHSYVWYEVPNIGRQAFFDRNLERFNLTVVRYLNIYLAFEFLIYKIFKDINQQCSISLCNLCTVIYA